VLPGLLTLALLTRVREAPRGERAAAAPVTAGPLPRAFWLALGVWVVFCLGNSSDAFLLLRAHDLGLSTTLAVLAYAGYNVVYASLSWPLGALSDRRSRTAILAGGLVVFALAYAGFALGPPTWALWPLFAVYGVYTAATDGVARAWIADRAPGRPAGSLYGIFAAGTGGALLLASVLAGLLWSRVGHGAPFWVGAATAAVAAVALVTPALASPRAR
jgi:MFS family permease